MDRNEEKLPSCYCDQYKADYNSTCYAKRNDTILVYHSNIENFADVPNNRSLPFVMHEQPEEEWNSYYTLAIAAVSIG